MNLDNLASVFTIIGGIAGVFGAVIGGIALVQSSKAKTTANEALYKITKMENNGDGNTTVRNQKVGKGSRVINGNNGSM
ncbi:MULTISPECIES: hypothetical protein [Lysinibacillus]|uniref:Uncharacterized protein n=1 Tax=Lysinibacillus varians TaxID=1145276 RepID=A0ABY2T5S7_9BACI|nr:hypothetical protein [Lysinibacillus varians]AHN24267.1 hypothetical protein T479_12655 [Lysinibacillus varians]QPQ35542.1 hypothetical protein JNUCC52_00970 [Lysinibacillus sp. JNUCC-52]TKI52590.1 hypothetical protein FC752_18555 [Lysinibacillus varians]